MEVVRDLTGSDIISEDRELTMSLLVLINYIKSAEEEREEAEKQEHISFIEAQIRQRFGDYDDIRNLATGIYTTINIGHGKSSEERISSLTLLQAHLGRISPDSLTSYVEQMIAISQEHDWQF